MPSTLLSLCSSQVKRRRRRTMTTPSTSFFFLLQCSLQAKRRRKRTHLACHLHFSFLLQLFAKGTTITPITSLFLFSYFNAVHRQKGGQWWYAPNALSNFFCCNASLWKGRRCTPSAFKFYLFLATMQPYEKEEVCLFLLISFVIASNPTHINKTQQHFTLLCCSFMCYLVCCLCFR